MKDFLGKKVGIVGFGITGQASAKFILENKGQVFIFESQKKENFEKVLEDQIFSKADLFFETEDIADNLLSEIDFLIASPGIKPFKNKILIKATENKIPVKNDITLFLEIWRQENPKSKIVGVTGSNGKSTVVSLLHHVLSDLKIPNILVGNIGDSPIKELSKTHKSETIVILELSSYQLELFEPLDKIDIPVITNLSSNHLDRYHGDMSEYAKAKIKISQNQTELILAENDLGTENFILPIVKEKNIDYIKVGPIKIDSLNFEKRKIKGQHNLYNIAFVLKILEKLNIKIEQKIIDAINNFSGLEHRVEFVSFVNEIAYYNDSKSTTPFSTKVAIDALALGRNIILILGGNDKDMNFDELKESISGKVKAIFYISGDATSKIKKAISETVLNEKIIEYDFSQDSNDLEKVIEKVKNMAINNDIVLFSPACASNFLKYKNFEERGKHFKSLVL